MLMKEFVIPVTTGLAIFLFGMQIMRIGFEHLFINKIKKKLSLLTNHVILGVFTGTVVTALLQSSSAVTLLTIGLVHSRIITFKQALGIVLGTNIGTCLTTELIAFDIHGFGIYFFIVGCICFLIPFSIIRAIGLASGGFGLLFIGMQTMQSILPFLKQTGWIETMYDFGTYGILEGVFTGTILTALIQSSTATTAITMNLMYDQLIPLSIAIAIILGSNIGTCMTAILASIATDKTARQVATAHVLLNLIGVLVFIPLIPLLSQIVEGMTTYPVQQVAHAQTIFNIVCSLVVLPFITYFEKLVILLHER